MKNRTPYNQQNSRNLIILPKTLDRSPSKNGQFVNHLVQTNKQNLNQTLVHDSTKPIDHSDTACQGFLVEILGFRETRISSNTGLIDGVTGCHPSLCKELGYLNVL